MSACLVTAKQNGFEGHGGDYVINIVLNEKEVPVIIDQSPSDSIRFL